MLVKIENYFMTYKEAIEVREALLYLKYYCKQLKDIINHSLSRMKLLINELETKKENATFKLKMPNSKSDNFESIALSKNEKKEIEKNLSVLEFSSTSSAKTQNSSFKETKDKKKIIFSQDHDNYKQNTNPEGINFESLENLNKAKNYEDLKKKLGEEINTLKSKTVEIVDEKKMKRIEKKKLKLQKSKVESTEKVQESDKTETIEQKGDDIKK